MNLIKIYLTLKKDLQILFLVKEKKYKNNISFFILKFIFKLRI